MKKEMNNKGFSLVELIIVIAIMAVLMGILAPQYLKYVRKSKISTDITNAENVATAVNAAIADGDTSAIKASGGAGGTVLISETSGKVVKLPDCKLTPGASWSITYDSTNGVTGISLGGTAIWPDASAYEAL